ncbi:hypothetical protein BN1723_012918 [Verticillium longisporum]|uniref:Uncharacterized protein n=1 Tax=Verticillium longisporum TaxID=100787 RepID=A0A0G4LN74_VERLO|nr:hypothetical protein BN1723_012918 [Verticillium longisporum]
MLKIASIVHGICLSLLIGMVEGIDQAVNPTLVGRLKLSPTELDKIKLLSQDTPASPGPVNLAAADVVIVNPDGDAWVQQHEDEEHRTSHAKSKGRIIKSCWECGSNCHDCIEQTQRFCRGCCGGYCTTHNEGSTAHFCDWCSSRGRFLRHL